MFLLSTVLANHYILLSKPANEMHTYNSYFASQHLCSEEFVNPYRKHSDTLKLRDTTNNTTVPLLDTFTD